MRKIQSMGFSDKVCRMLFALYRGDRFTVLLDETIGDWFEVEIGCHEGSCLSPTLFILFINDLSEFVLQRVTDMSDIPTLPDGSQIGLLLYADDIMILANSPSTLQDMIDAVVNYCGLQGLAVNAAKCEILPLHNDSEIFDQEVWGIDNELSFAVSYARYLGLFFDTTGRWEQQALVLKKRTRQALGRCKVMSHVLTREKTVSIANLFDVMVASVFRFALGAWGTSRRANTRFMDDAFVEFITYALKLPVACCKRSILAEFGRRCSRCDAVFLASIEVARGLSQRETIWGKLVSAIDVARVPFLRDIYSQLEVMQLLDAVRDGPETYIAQRRMFAVRIAQYCHFNHLNRFTRSSADVQRAFKNSGISAYMYFPQSISRLILLFRLGSWKWTRELQGARRLGLLDFCNGCDSRLDTDHVLFRCAIFEQFRGFMEDMEQPRLVFDDESRIESLFSLCSEIVRYFSSKASQVQ